MWVWVRNKYHRFAVLDIVTAVDEVDAFVTPPYNIINLLLNISQQHILQPIVCSFKHVTNCVQKNVFLIVINIIINSSLYPNPVLFVTMSLTILSYIHVLSCIQISPSISSSNWRQPPGTVSKILRTTSQLIPRPMKLTSVHVLLYLYNTLCTFFESS